MIEEGSLPVAITTLVHRFPSHDWALRTRKWVFRCFYFTGTDLNKTGSLTSTAEGGLSVRPSASERVFRMGKLVEWPS